MHRRAFYKVYRDNISELAKCMDMFSGEDTGRIMKAIRQDPFINQKNHDIDEMVNGIGDVSGNQEPDHLLQKTDHSLHRVS